MTDINDVCVELEKWSRELTKGAAFPRKYNPTSLAWRSLLGTTEMGSSMKYLLSHLKPARETQLIRKNIRHMKFNQELFGNKDELKTEATRKFSETHKTNEISPLIEDLQVLNLESKKLNEQQERLEMQKAALNILIDSRTTETIEFLRFTEDLRNVDKIRDVRDPTPSNVVAIERYIRQIMNELKAIRLRLMQSYQDKDSEIHERKLELWTMVEELLSNTSAEVILRALINVAQVHTDEMETNVKNDIMEERVSRELSSNASNEIEKSVRDLLVGMCAKHVKTRVEAHNHQYTAKCAEAAAIVMRNNAIESFRKGTSDELCLKYAEDVMSAKLTIAGQREQLLKMVNIRSDLNKRIQMAKIAERKLIDDHRKIAEFDEQVQTGLFHIKGLEMNQGQSDLMIKQELNHVQDLVLNSVNEMSIPTQFEFIDDEFKLCFRNLRDRTAICVSNCAVGPTDIDLCEEKTRRVSNLCSYQTTWENLLFICMQQNQMKRHLKQRIDRNKSDCEAMSAVFQYPNLTLNHAKDLLRKCDKYDENLTSEVTPLLNNCCDQLATNYKKVFNLISLVDDWWNQPCQRIKL